MIEPGNPYLKPLYTSSWSKLREWQRTQLRKEYRFLRTTGGCRRVAAKGAIFRTVMFCDPKWAD